MTKRTLPPPESTTVKRSLPVLSAKEIKAAVLEKCAPSEERVYGNGKHNVFILPEAAAEHNNIVCFGKQRPVNHYEQQYQGLGYLFTDPDGNVNAVITHFIHIYSACRGKVFAEVCGKDSSMLDILKSEREIYNKFEAEFNDYDGTGKYEINPFLNYGKSIVMTNAHTHPGLTCFFSPPDKASSYACDGFPAVTLVCDPINEDIKAMVGFDEDTKVTVFNYATQNESGVLDDVAEKLKALFESLCGINGVKGKMKCSRGKGSKLDLSFSFGYKPEGKK